MRRSKIRAVLSLLAGFVVLAVIAPGCGGGEPSGVFKQAIGPDGGALSVGDEIVVRIPVGALASDARLTITPATEEDPGPGELEAAKSVGPAFNIDLGGHELSKPVVLEIAFDPDLLPQDSPQDAVFLAFYDEENKQWVPVYGTVDLARHVVVVETEHLSWWNPFSWDLSELWTKIRRRLESLLEFGGLPVAEVPQCGSAPTHMTLDFTDSLLACIEGTETEGQAVLKLVNNRAYATLVELRPGVELIDDVSHGSLTDAPWQLLVDKLSEDVVYVPPAGEAEFLLRFEEEGEISLSSAPSDITLALDVLLLIPSVLGVDPDNVVDGLKCLFEIMTPEQREPPTFGDLLDLTSECVGVVLKGTTGLAWTAIKSLVTLGAAVGELGVQRTEELFGGDQGEVSVTYSPPLAEEPPSQEPPPQEAPGEPPAGIPGVYVNPANRSEYLELKEDGTFFFKAEALMGFLRGEWEEKGNDIILSYYYFGFPGDAEGEIQNNRMTVVDEDGQVWTEGWVKEDVLKIGGSYALSVGARYRVEVIEHYLVERGRDPRLYLEYRNIADEPIDVTIGILWTDENGLFLKDGGQENTRGPIPPGHTERLTYRPRSDLSPAEIMNYYLEIRAYEWGQPRLPHAEAGPEIEPEGVYSR